MTRPAFLLDSDIKEIVDHLPLGALEQLAGKHLLITGGRGFLGRYFTAVLVHLNEKHLAANPVRVTCLDNFISAGEAGREIVEQPNVRFVEHDVIEPYQAGKWVADGGFTGFDPERIDFILHAAGIASPAHYRKHPLATAEVAITGLKNSLELAKANPGCKIAFFSSSEIYGDPPADAVPTPETYRGNVACLGPRSCYDSSKRMGEGYVQIYAEQYGVHATIIRPFNVYGPGMQATDYRVLPNFAAKIALGEPLEIYGDGKQTRTYCYVADAIGGFLRVLLFGKPGEPYNIGNPSPELSVSKLAGVVNEIVGPDVWPGCHITPHPASYPADEPSRRCPDISKAMRELDYRPRIELREGLDRFFKWALGVYPRPEPPEQQQPIAVIADATAP